MKRAILAFIFVSLLPVAVFGSGWSLRLFHFPEEIIVTSDTALTLAMGTIVNVSATETENKGITVEIWWGEVVDNFEFYTVFEYEGEYYQTSPYQVNSSLPNKKIYDIMTPDAVYLPPCIDREEDD
ncbi:hypothetical protein JW890_00410 [candidate division WOR-3 bacterium]|nr:hypothetical protein [candidate division WOR-3 bacterium]